MPYIYQLLLTILLSLPVPGFSREVDHPQMRTVLEQLGVQSYRGTIKHGGSIFDLIVIERSRYRLGNWQEKLSRDFYIWRPNSNAPFHVLVSKAENPGCCSGDAGERLDSLLTTALSLMEVEFSANDAFLVMLPIGAMMQQLNSPVASFAEAFPEWWGATIPGEIVMASVIELETFKIVSVTLVSEKTVELVFELVTHALAQQGYRSLELGYGDGANRSGHWAKERTYIRGADVIHVVGEFVETFGKTVVHVNELSK